MAGKREEPTEEVLDPVAEACAESPAEDEDVEVGWKLYRLWCFGGGAGG